MCTAQLNLVSTHAGNGVPYIKKFGTILRQLYDFLTCSNSRTTSCSESNTQIWKLLPPCSTRWLNIERRLRTCFASVVLILQREGEERSDAKALGLYRFVCTMLLVCDVLPHVSLYQNAFRPPTVTTASAQFMQSNSLRQVMQCWNS